MNINLHIERLILEDIDIAPAQRHLLEATLTTELARLLHDGGIARNLVRGGFFSSMSTNSIKLMGSNPKQLGRQIAKSLFAGLGHD